MATNSIIVIGMHRSGTSALSGELARLGVFMGKTLVKPQAGVNDKGFWENARLLKINEKLLDRLNSDWDDPLNLDLDSTALLQQSSLFKEACDFIASDYAGSDLWGMKDPRVSVLLPFWRAVLEQCGYTPRYILMVRHPLEVAASLKKRDAFSQAKGLMLWLNYNLCSHYQVLDQQPLVVDFAQLLDNPTAVTARIAETFELAFDPGPTSESFIDRKLKRQSAEAAASASELESLALELYGAMITGDHARVDSVDRRYRQRLNALDPVLLEHLNQVKRSEVHFRNAFERAYYTYSWKVTRSLRWVEERCRQVF